METPNPFLHPALSPQLQQGFQSAVMRGGGSLLPASVKQHSKAAGSTGQATSGSAGAGATQTLDMLDHALDAWSADQAPAKSSTTVRWSKSNLSNLSLYVGPESEPWMGIIEAATHQWTEAGQGALQFYLAQYPEQAHIVIQWTDTPSLGRDYEVGHVDRKVDHQGYITQAVMTLLTEPAIDLHLNPSQIQSRQLATLLHELGHALGLDHSDLSTDVMYYQGWRNTHLTPHDMAQLRDRYPHIARQRS